MKTKISAIATFLTIFSTQFLFAQLSIEEDLLIDNTNQREWVRLYVTEGMSHNEVQFETQPGRMFEGFQIATSADFVELADAFGGLLADLPLHSPEYPSELLTNLVGFCTLVDPFTNLLGGHQGILSSELSAAGEKDAFAIGDELPKYYETESFAANIAREGYGVMLFRDFCDPCAPLLGDVNLDGAVNLLDVQPFVDILTLGEFQNEADVNIDGFVDLLDVQPFVEILASN